MQIRLYSGQIQGGQPLEIGAATPASLDRACRLVYDGIFQSMDGEVRITRSLMELIAEKHNARIGAAGGNLPIGECPPVQLDHTKSARDTVGRLVGPLTVSDDMIDGEIKPALLGTVRFLGSDNVERAIDGRYSNVSIGADLETGVLSELSVTPFPAAPRASLLSKGSTMPDEMKARCKKYLTSEKKMSEEDADKHLASLSDDDAKKLGAEVDDHEKKMAAEDDKDKKDLADGDKDKDDKKELGAGDKGETKLTAAKPKLKQLMADATAAIKLASAEAKNSSISVKLAKLRARALITPAEEKKLLAKLTTEAKKEVRLAEASDDALDLVWAVLEAREPVVHIGQFGSVKVVDLAAAGGALKRARLGQAEQEVLVNMPFTRAMIQATAGESKETKLASGEKPTRPADVVVDEPTVPTNIVDEQKRVDALQEQITKLSGIVTAIASELE